MAWIGLDGQFKLLRVGPSVIPKETPIPTNGPWLTGLEL